MAKHPDEESPYLLGSSLVYEPVKLMDDVKQKITQNGLKQ